MSRSRVKINPPLVILSGATSSNELNGSSGPLRTVFGALVDLIIYGPATLPDVTTVMVSSLDTPLVAGDWKSLKVGGVVITVGAGEAVVIPVAGFSSLKLSSAGTVGADRTFAMTGQVDP